MTLYETVCVIKPDVQGADLEKVVQKVQKVCNDHKVKDVKQNDWGIRKLAYPIQKLKTAHYVQFVYEGGGSLVTDLERQLNYEDSILRFLSLKIEEGIDPNSKPDEFQFGKVEFNPHAGRGRRDFKGKRDYGRKPAGDYKRSEKPEKSEEEKS